jgi:hypothetical protein
MPDEKNPDQLVADSMTDSRWAGAGWVNGDRLLTRALFSISTGKRTLSAGQEKGATLD